MNGLTLRQFEYLDAVAQEGTIAGAAGRMEVSPAAVGQALVEMDRILGTPLTQRRRAKGVELTPAGEVVASTAREIVRMVSQLPIEIAANAADGARQFTVGLYPSISTWIAPELLAFARQHYPGVTVDFIEGGIDELYESMDRGDIDAFFAHRNQLSGEVRAFSLRQLRPYILVSRDHPLAAQAGVHFHELVKEDFVLSDTVPAGKIVTDILQARGLAENIRWRSRNVETVKGIVGRGLGVSLLYSFDSHKRTLADEGLVNLPLVDLVRGNEAVLCIPESFPTSPFINSVIEHFRNLPVPSDIADRWER